jgi:hypothetical protein
MHFTQALIIAIVAVTGAQALGRAPPPRPAPPAPVFNTQSISCGGNGSPYCCSPSASNTDNLVATNGASKRSPSSGDPVAPLTDAS